MRMSEYLEDEYKKRTSTISGMTNIHRLDVEERHNHMFAIEKKYNGLRATIHKRGSDVKIFSDTGKDITIPFPRVVEQISKMVDSDFIIDCEIVPHKGNEPLGREVAVNYLNSVEVDKQIDDKGIIFYAFDCAYYNKDISNLPWFKRKRILHSMKFTEYIKEAGSIVVNNRDDAIKTINMFRNMPGSKGALIKRHNGKYAVDKKSDDWFTSMEVKS